MQSKTVYKHLSIPFRVPRQVPHLHYQFPTIRVHAQQPSSSGSYDSEGDELLKEFQQYADPNKLQKITKRLELTWSVDRVRTFRIVICSDWVLPHKLYSDTVLQRRQPAPCDCCDGSGQKECTWCRGTGAKPVGKAFQLSLLLSVRKAALCCRCNDGRRRALLFACPWLQAMPHMQQQGEV